ncbi:dihydrodipicolinate synthase family protein [Paracoccus sp. (in: a-proteobacteria)]|uniref:dihydrodipicolinate synthase family protein n=1 Tax=Paracoccus sp. TaxID=267 RepID=UPI00272C3ED0|nr:dihydrodipicolinate synthase family protein [Paracoccus sp. (in: a-proteobacteria)]
MSVMRGLSAFPITPATPEGRVIEADLRRILTRLVRAEVDSIGLLGSTGSYAYLTLDERRRTLEIALDVTRGRVPVIAGIGALTTRDSVALARHAAEAGAEGLLLAPVSYTPLTEDEIVAHYAAVADAGGLPLCIYNNPTTTRVTMNHALIARLAALPHVEAIKMPLPAAGTIADEVAALRPLLPEDFVIGYSGDWGCTRALLDKADAWFSVVAGLWPDMTLTLSCAAQAGDATGTRRTEERFQPLWDLLRRYGSLRVAHAAARLMDLTEAQPQPPIMPLPEAEIPALRAAIRAMEA